MKLVKEIDSFEPKDIFECGQCFRWNREENGSYTGVFSDCVLNVKKCEGNIVFNGNENVTEEKINEYFDLNRDYSKIKKELSKVDNNLLEATNFGRGIRILNQDLWETIISFIISANNNIPRIKGIIEKISKKYGKEIKFNEKSYYEFPTPKELSKATVEDLKNLGLGFRDVRVYETTQMINSKEFDLDKLYTLDTKQAQEKLLTLSGVGPKVADCILLFSTLKRFDVFPIDVWVRRVMNDLYIHEQDEKKLNKNYIRKIADTKFGTLEGMAQQYLFYWKREQSA